MVTLNHPAAGDTNWYSPVDANWTTLEGALTFPSGQIPFSSGTTLQGSSSLIWDNTNSQLELGNGSGAHPAYSWVSETNSGFYRAAANDFKLSVAGADRFRFAGAFLTLSSIGGFAVSPNADLTAADVFLVRDAAATWAVRNAANAQTVRIYNTFTDASNGEWLQSGWSGNIAFLDVQHNGTGTIRQFELRNNTNSLLRIPTTFCLSLGLPGSTTGTGNVIDIGASGSWSTTSGTIVGMNFNQVYRDQGTNSSTVINALALTNTVNYTGATRTGKVYLQYMNPTLTSLPTGNNAGLVFSSAFTNSSFPALRLFNTSDEDTNTEFAEMGWHIFSNAFVIRTKSTGTGTARNLALNFSGTTNAALLVPNSIGGTVDVGICQGAATSIVDGHVRVGNYSVAATSATDTTLTLNTTFNPSSTSTQVGRVMNLAPTVNYSAVTPGAGKVYLAYLNPTLTALPTGHNGGLVFSSAFTNSSFPAVRFFNTSDEDTNSEWFEAGWHVSSNFFVIRTHHSGTGSGRILSLNYSGSAGNAVQIPTSAASAVDLGAVGIAVVAANGRASVGRVSSVTATSGTHYELTVGFGTGAGPAPTSTSTMQYVGVGIAPTINYSAGTPGAGYVYGVYVNPLNTAVPTGISAAIALSSSASGINGVVWNNQSDEQTNYEHVRTFFTSNVWTIGSYKGGTGTLRGIQVGISGNSLGFFGATPVAQPSSTGETVGFTAGTGTTVHDDSTFTGNVGSTAYRISDVIKHLKKLGLLAQ